MKLLRCKLCDDVILDPTFTTIETVDQLKEDYHNDCWELAALEFWQSETAYRVIEIE